MENKSVPEPYRNSQPSVIQHRVDTKMFLSGHRVPCVWSGGEEASCTAVVNSLIISQCPKLHPSSISFHETVGGTSGVSQPVVVSQSAELESKKETRVSLITRVSFCLYFLNRIFQKEIREDCFKINRSKSKWRGIFVHFLLLNMSYGPLKLQVWVS